jgi:hypothetical protein
VNRNFTLADNLHIVKPLIACLCTAKQGYGLYTIKNISLNLVLCVAKFVKCIIGLFCQGTVLNRSNNVDKDIILQANKY